MHAVLDCSKKTYLSVFQSRTSIKYVIIYDLLIITEQNRNPNHLYIVL